MEAVVERLQLNCHGVFEHVFEVGVNIFLSAAIHIASNYQIIVYSNDTGIYIQEYLQGKAIIWNMLLRYGKNIHKLDMIQRRAARYACNRYHNISSVTEMVGHLGWEPLATRRRNMRLCMMYKIVHTVVGDPWTLTTTKRVTRGFHAWKYIPIYSQHNIYKFSFLPRTIIDWNSLSPHSVDSPSIDTFRARITRN